MYLPIIVNSGVCVIGEGGMRERERERERRERERENRDGIREKKVNQLEGREREYKGQRARERESD